MALGQYAKALVSVLVVVGTGIAAALDDNGITWLEGITVAIAALGSGGVVWYVQNGPEAQYAKAVVGALTAALSSLAVGLGDNTITSQEWVTALVAGVVGLGVVAAVPNADPK